MWASLPRRAHDLTGRRFGRLVALGPVEIVRYTGATQIKWLCRCDCGGETRALAQNLRKGHSGSCGCLIREVCGNNFRTHGQGGRKITPEYRAWTKMKERCLDPRNKRYADWGGRGISICREWLNDFQRFYSDMGKRPSPDHSLDRINVNGNYEPGNCRWATRLEQARNKRNTRSTH